MYSKTLFAAAALAATVAAYDMPTCWSSCFAQYQVDSEGCLCSDALGSVVSSCISSGCSPDDNSAYTSWLSEYCAATEPTTNTYPAPATTAPPPSTYSPTDPETTAPPPSTYSPSEPSGTSPPSYSTDPETTTTDEPTGYPTPTGYETTSTDEPTGYPTATSEPTGYTSAPDGTAPPYPTGTDSFCTSTSTLIYRSSTAYATYTVTPGAYGTAGGYGTAAPTGYAPSGYPVPATGGAQKIVGAGVAMMIGGAAALLL